MRSAEEDMTLKVLLLLSPLLLLAVSTIMPTAMAQISGTIPPPSQLASNVTATNTTITNATATNTTTTVLMHVTEFNGDIRTLSPQAIQFQQQDPLFAKFVQMSDQCQSEAAKGVTATGRSLDEMIKYERSCALILRQGLNTFCGFEISADVQKCSEAKLLVERFINFVTYVLGLS